MNEALRCVNLSSPVGTRPLGPASWRTVGTRWVGVGELEVLLNRHWMPKESSGKKCFTVACSERSIKTCSTTFPVAGFIFQLICFNLMFLKHLLLEVQGSSPALWEEDAMLKLHCDSLLSDSTSADSTSADSTSEPRRARRPG